MSCNCKTTEKIIKIHKDYGYKINVSWKENLKFKINEIVKILIILFIALIFSPLIFIVIIVLALIGKTNINISKFLNRILKKKK